MLRRRNLLACAFCAAAAARPVAAQPDATPAPQRLMPYAPEELQRRGARLAQHMPRLFADDLRARLPAPWPERLHDVTLDLPAGEEGELPPLHFAAFTGARLVQAPLRTLLFLEDLAGLWAHLERRRCGLEPAQRYMAMLFVKPADGERPPGPLAAFGLDERIYEDSQVKDTSNKLLNSAVFFLLAHELGHIALDHWPGMVGLPAQRQEREADAFALDACAAVRLAPIGLGMYFTAAAVIEGQQAGHPLTPARLNALAMALRERRRYFVDRGERDPTRAAQAVTAVAGQLEQVGETLERPGLRVLLQRRAAATGWADLRGSCPA
jgi:hypothetical protein